MYWHFFTVVVLMPVIALGQSGYYTLNGQIHIKNGETYPYKLYLRVHGQLLRGYSVTKLADGSEPKISVEGKLEVEKKIMAIQEKKLMGYLPEHLSLCLVDAVLSFNPQNTRHPLAGNFISKDSLDKFCGDGTITFDPSAGIHAIFGIDKPGSTTPIDTEVNPPNGEYEVTSGVTRQFEWKTDTCILDIYDGGLIDGDEISIVCDGRNVLSNYVLARQKKQVKLYLKKKLNTIVIVAGNEGTISPNTANIILTDGDLQYKIKAFNKTGEKATILLHRK